VLRETLETNGTMSRLRASIRAQVFGALQDENERVPRPTKENLIINDLIREYLAFNHYDHALAVFVAGMDAHHRGQGW
jgi:lisH domain-containing protein FOPNL